VAIGSGTFRIPVPDRIGISGLPGSLLANIPAGEGDVHLNGRLTLGENTADNGGARIALMALHNGQQSGSASGKPATPAEGDFTPDQRFFLGWSQVWRGKARNEDLRARLLSDPHSPDEFRTTPLTSYGTQKAIAA